MLDFDKPIQTRDGRAVRIAFKDYKTATGHYTILACVTQLDGSETSEIYTAEGKFYTDNDNHHLDLVNVPEDRVVFVNVYDNGAAGGHNSMGLAKLSLSTKHPAISGDTLKVTFRDGKIVRVFVVEAE